jgi:hypothetical protein
MKRSGIVGHFRRSGAHQHIPRSQAARGASLIFVMSASRSIGGRALPRRSARRKIPAQALGDKEYFTGASPSKIHDKKDSPASLCRSEILGVVHAPSEVNASASYHSSVCPSPSSRKRNFGFCERLKHGFKITSGGLPAG